MSMLEWTHDKDASKLWLVCSDCKCLAAAATTAAAAAALLCGMIANQAVVLYSGCVTTETRRERQQTGPAARQIAIYSGCGRLSGSGDDQSVMHDLPMACRGGPWSPL